MKRKANHDVRVLHVVEQLRLGADLAGFAMHTSAARAALRRGAQPPTPPAPVSTLLRDFMQTLRDKVAAVAALLHVDERDPLAKIAPGFVRSVQAEDPDVVDVVTTLMRLPPDLVTLWIRMQLDAIERRFAS